MSCLFPSTPSPIYPPAQPEKLVAEGEKKGQQLGLWRPPLPCPGHFQSHRTGHPGEMEVPWGSPWSHTLSCFPGRNWPGPLPSRAELDLGRNCSHPQRLAPTTPTWDPTCKGQGGAGGPAGRRGAGSHCRSILGSGPEVNRCIWTPAGGSGPAPGAGLGLSVWGSRVLLTMGWAGGPGPADTFLYVEEEANTGDKGREDLAPRRGLCEATHAGPRARLTSVSCRAGNEVHRAHGWPSPTCVPASLLLPGGLGRGHLKGPHAGA